MANEGQLLGQVFNLPPPIESYQSQRRYAQPDIPQDNPDYFGIPEAQYGLQSTANVADHTAGYYQKLAGLRSFAQGMWQNYGIDVTKPDYSRPEAVAASQAFQMELANAEAQANEAKNAQDLYSKAANYELQNQYQMGQADQIPGGYFDTSLDRGQYSTAVDPTVQLYANQYGKPFDERSEVTYGEQQRDALANMYANQGTLQGQQNALQAQAINPSFNVPSQQTPFPGQGDPNLLMFRKYALLANGSPDYFKESNEFTPGGSRYGISSVDAGTRLGDYTDSKGVVRPLIIDHYKFDPDTNTMFVYAEGDKTPVREVKGEKLLNFLSEVASSNTGGIVTGKSLRDWMSANGYDMSKDVSGQKLITQQELGAIDKSKQSLQIPKEKVKEIRNSLSKELDSLEPLGVLGIGGTSLLHPGEQNRVLMKGKNGLFYFTKPGFVGSNVLKGSAVGVRKGTTNDYTVDGVDFTSKELSDGFTKDKAMQYLEKSGYVSSRLDVQKPEQPPVTIKGQPYSYAEVEQAAKESGFNSVEEYLNWLNQQ